MDIPTLWVFGGYVLGTVTGWYMTRKAISSVFEAGVAATIDELIDEGYLKAVTQPDGQVTLEKYPNLVND